MSRSNVAVAIVASLALAGLAHAQEQAPEPDSGSSPPQLSLPATPGEPSGELLFVPEGNRLRVYDTGSLEEQILIPSVSDARRDPEYPNALGRDINGQVCAHVVNSALRIITGEDSKDDDGERPGWGEIEVTGSQIGDFAWRQVGKLAPHYAGAPDNHGCAFRSNGDLFTGAIGDILPGQPATGELLLWFQDPDGGFGQGFVEHTNSDGGVYTEGTVPYCKLDVRLATTGGFYRGTRPGGSDVLYVAANRPDDDLNPGGVFRYSGDFPTGPDEAGGCGRTVKTPLRDSTDAIQTDENGDPILVDEPFVSEGRITKTLFIPASTSLTPSSVTGSGRFLPDPFSGEELETLYVSSVFTGTVAEYDANGVFLRYVLNPPGPLPIGQVTGITPFGLAIDGARALYVADLGILGPGPVGFFGSVVRVPFVETPLADAVTIPLPPETIRDGLTFPDGIGIATLP